MEFFYEANRFSATQEIPRILWNPKGSLREEITFEHLGP
jgi:hypothetical protein